MARSTLYDEFLHFVRENRLFEKGERVLAAVSGGPDSVAMLDLLRRFRDRGEIELFACHLDHGLRGEDSRADAAFVAELTERINIPLETARANVRLRAKRRGMSIETAAREARYEFFGKCARKLKCPKVATAHTLSDNAETILQRVIEGTGTDGLCGIPCRRDIPGRGLVEVVRPLLFATRDDVERYLSARALESRLDRSNLEPIYLRNRVRLEILPLLKELNPSVERAIARLAESVARLTECVEDDVAAAAGVIILARRRRSVVLNRNAIAEISPPVASEVVKAVLLDLLPDARKILHSHIDGVIELACGENPAASMHLPGGFEARREYGFIFIRPREEESGPGPFEGRLEVPGEVVLPGGAGRITARFAAGVALDEFIAGKSAGKEVIDADAVKGVLSVRFPRAGDRFRPLGGGAKKLQDFFVDEKVPRKARAAIPLVCDGAGIVWVAGHRIAERVKVTVSTRRSIVLELR